MIKDLEIKNNVNDNIICMCDMEPLDVGVIDDDSEYGGHIVMRTASLFFEVMDLSVPGEDNCWTDEPELPVRLLPPNTTIKFTVA